MENHDNATLDLARRKEERQKALGAIEAALSNLLAQMRELKAERETLKTLGLTDGFREAMERSP